jgi:hypothetical protein
MSHIFFQNFSMNEWGSLIAHIYSVAKATTLVYLFHERSYVASLVGIAAILIKLRLLIQQYFDIADYVVSSYRQSSPIGVRLGSYQGTWQAIGMCQSPLAV